MIIKETIGVIAVVLSFVAYVPYIRDILKGKTKPHIYSWFVWGFLTTIIFALQVKGNGGPGAWVTLSAGVFSFIVFFLGLKHGDKNITKSDTVFFIAALVATGIWMFAKQPALSVILLVSIDMIGFIPTIRKSWKKPHEETLFLWSLNGFRHGLSILALRQYSILTVLYPAVWTAANILFSLMLVIRRKNLSVAHSTD
ncbi:MAG TPA: hypothetical protein VIH90_04980 [Candidatus Saccharimonadales bacterium]